MENDLIMQLLRRLGKKRRQNVQEAENLRREIHEASLRAVAAGMNNQQIAQEIGVTREIIRRHVGPSKAFAEVGTEHGVEAERGEQERS